MDDRNRRATGEGALRHPLHGREPVAVNVATHARCLSQPRRARGDVVRAGRIVSKRLAPDALGYSIDLYRALYEDDMRAHALEIAFFQRLDDKAAGALQQLNEPDLRDLPSEALEIWWHFILGLFTAPPRISPM